MDPGFWFTVLLSFLFAVTLATADLFLNFSPTQWIQHPELVILPPTVGYCCEVCLTALHFFIPSTFINLFPLAELSFSTIFKYWNYSLTQYGHTFACFIRWVTIQSHDYLLCYFQIVPYLALVMASR